VADDIDLPNLVSHLAVNLDGLSGTVADAGRQGSSVGAALGGGIQRELQGLLAHLPDIPIDANSDQVDRDLARVREQLQELSSQRIGIDIPIDQALRRIRELQPHIQRLSDEHPEINVQAATRAAARHLDDLLAAARRVDDTDVDIDVDVDEERPRRLAGVLGRIGSAAGSAVGALSGVAGAAAKLGAAVPAAASLVTTLANVAPAAGVAVTGLAAVKLAQGTIKLAAVGMEDALSAALDPGKAEEYAEALEKLSPEARKFAEAVHDAAPALRSLQQDVQDEVFRGLADNLERTGKVVLPVLRTNLLSTATALGDMAAGAMGAARDLAEDGTLGQALSSASAGLSHLSGVPGIVARSLGQIAAAAGPSFEGLTAAAAHSANAIGERLNAAFESGRMREAIQHAIDLLGDLVDVGSNVAEIIGAVFSAVPSGGGGLIGVLQEVTRAIADVANTATVQDALRSLFETMNTVGTTVAPLLASALLAIAPVFTALGPPVQLLVQTLGDALGPVIEALGPVLQAVATAVGELVVAASPLLTVLGELITALLPVVMPLFEALSDVFAQIAPIVQQVADVLLQALGPILAQMPQFVAPFADLLVQLAETLLPVLGDLLLQLAPSLVTLGAAFAELLVAASPILEAFGKLAVLALSHLLPAIQPLIDIAISLATTLASILAGTITNVVVPVLRFVAKLLTGDFSGAWEMAQNGVSKATSWISEKASALGRLIGDAVSAAVKWLAGLPGRSLSALASFASAVSAPAIRAGSALVTAIREKISAAIEWVKGLPGRARESIGNLNSVLIEAGKSLIRGFINGLAAMFGEVRSKLGELTSSLPDWKGPAKRDATILTPAGRAVILGFIKGIDGTTPQVQKALAALTRALPRDMRSAIAKSLARSTRQLSDLVRQREGVIRRLAAAEKRLADLQKQRAEYAADVRQNILADANITTGNAEVNSVTAITVGLQQALKATQEYEANIAKLAKSGLRSDLLQQISDAGVAAGGATAAALAKATPAELKKINDLQGQLAKSASATSSTVGDALYGAGIRAAQGLVAGLRSQERVIEAQMRRIALGMLSTVRHVHRTHSPSEAFREIGVMDGEGLRGGILATAKRVADAARSMALGALDAASGVGAALAGTPTGGQLAAVYAGGRAGDQTTHFHLYGSEASPDGILRALSWRGLVGGR
jgi:phage-related protein